MKQFKKTLSIFMVAIFVMGGVLDNVTAKAVVINIVTPIINYVGVEHSPLVVGDTEKFTVTSKYDGLVQYRAFLFDGKKWSELTSGYGIAVDAKTPYVLPETPAFKLGEHKLSVWVKRAGKKGTNSNKDYDTYYAPVLNCVTRDNASRVYASGAPKVETNGLTVKFNGIENIGGIKGPYLYRLHIYNPITGAWTSSEKEYTETPSYTFKEAGTYMVIVHANTVNSPTWKNYIAGKTKGAYEAFKTILVTVKNEEIVKVFDTTVKATNSGSTVNVTLTADGVKHLATAVQYQIFDGTNALSTVTNLGADAIVVPAKASGDKVSVKLFDASAKVVKDIEVILGKSGTITVIPPIAITSVRAINAKQVEIKFNTPVNRECAENADNYKITGSDGSIMYIGKVAYLDSTTVRATLDFTNSTDDQNSIGTDIALNDGSSYKLTVSKYLVDAGGKVRIADLTSDFTFTDTTIPTITEVSLGRGVVVSFSEPIKIKYPNSYQFRLMLLDKNGIQTGSNLLENGTLNDGGYARWADDEHKTIFTSTYLGIGLNEGSRYRLSLIDTFTDYAGHNVPLKSIDITYIANKDTTVSKVLSTKVISQKYVEVSFNKPIGDASPNIFYWNADGVESNSVNKASEVIPVNATTYRVVFGNLMLEGNGFLFIRDNNTTSTTKHPITVTAGLSPVVTGVVMNTKRQIEVKYNVDVNSLDTYLYSLQDSVGLVVGIANVQDGVKADGITPDKSVKLINVSSDLTVGVSKLTVSGLKDSLGRVIAAHSQSLSVPVTLTGRMAVAYSDATNVSTNDTLVVSFEERLSESARDEANWLINTKLGYKSLNEIDGGAFTSGTSDNVFIIKLPQGTLPTTGNSVQFANEKNVYDQGQNLVEPVTINIGNLQTGKKVDLSVAYAATTWSKRLIDVTIDNALLNDVKLSDFVLKADGVIQNVSYIATQNNVTRVSTAGTADLDGRSTITLTLTNDVDTSKEYVLSTVAAPESTDIYGAKFVGSKSVVITTGTSNAINSVFVQGDDLNLFLKDSATSILPVKSDFSVKSLTGTSVTVNSVGESIFRGKKSIVLHTSGLNPGTAYMVNLKDNAVTTVDGKSLESGDYLSTQSLIATSMYVDDGLNATTIDGDEYIIITFSDRIYPNTIIDAWSGKEDIVRVANIPLIATDGGAEGLDTLSLGNAGLITFSGNQITASGSILGTISMTHLNQIKVKLGSGTTTAKFAPVVNGTMTYNVSPVLASYFAPIDSNSSITKPASSFLSGQ